MSTLDEITKERQRLGEALARIDAQREKLTDQLGELEATERVLTRYSKGTQAKRTPSAKTPTMATKAADAERPRGRGRTTAAKPAGGKRTSPTLGDQVLALANGKTQQEIAAACKGARPNHVGVVIARHKRAGRIAERDERFIVRRGSSLRSRLWYWGRQPLRPSSALTHRQVCAVAHEYENEAPTAWHRARSPGPGSVPTGIVPCSRPSRHG